MSTFGTGSIPEAAFGKNTTVRASRVNQQQGASILAGKKAALLAMASSKPAVSSNLRPPAQNISRVMPEQTMQAHSSLIGVTNKMRGYK